MQLQFITQVVDSNSDIRLCDASATTTSQLEVRGFHHPRLRHKYHAQYSQMHT